MSSLLGHQRGAQGGGAQVAVAVDPRYTITAWQRRAVEVARMLLPTQRAVLVRALTPELLGLGSPYVPASTEEDHVAASLTQPSLGLLWPQDVSHAGRTNIYRPTPFGRLVLQAFLLERVAGERIGAWPPEPADRGDWDRVDGRDGQVCQGRGMLGRRGHGR
jgi:hypothetical protein